MQRLFGGPREDITYIKVKLGEIGSGKYLNKNINVTSDIKVTNHISGGRTSDTVALKNFLYRKAR